LLQTAHKVKATDKQYKYEMPQSHVYCICGLHSRVTAGFTPRFIWLLIYIVAEM